METAELLLDRFKGMESARLSYEATWRELAQMFQPMKGLGFGSGPSTGQAGDELIWDSTPAAAKGMMDSRVFGMVMNPAEKWLGFGFRDLRNGRDEGGDFKDWAAKASETTLHILSNEETNFYTAGAEAIEEESLFGTSCKYTEEDDESLVHVQAIPLAEVYVAESARGVVDTVYRKYEMTVRQCIQTWKSAKVSEDVRKLMADNQPEKKVQLLHCVYPRTDIMPGTKGNKAMPFASVYMEIKSKHVLEESGYHEMPYSCPRWEKGAGEVYGRGAALPALADVRTLYSMVRTAMMGAEKLADPPLMVPDDGFLGPIQSGPGGLSYYRAGSTDRIESLPVKADIATTYQMIEAKRNAVREWFYSNQFDDPSRPNMTATEAQLKYSERWKTLAGVLGRLQSEDLTPLMRRILMVLIRKGVVEDLPEGYTLRNVRFYYTGPLTQAQKQAGMQNIRVLMEAVSPLVGEQDPYGVMDNFDVDEIARVAHESSGADSKILRTKNARDSMREQKAKARQEQETLAQVDALVSTAKTASQADMSKPNGLTALMGGGQ